MEFSSRHRETFDASRRPARGAILDIDTGALRKNHVLMQSTAIGDVFIGLGPIAKQALDFAFDDRSSSDPCFENYRAIDEALAVDDVAKAHEFGVPAELARIDDPNLRRLAIIETLLCKASPDDPIRPGWPAGAPNSLGGKFRPKDKTEQTKEDARRLGARRQFRTAAFHALKAGVMVLLDAMPGLDAITAPMTLYELAQTAIDLGNDQKEVEATVAFIENGPYTLDELRASPEQASFSSYDAFLKLANGAALAWVKQYGRAGNGLEYHHIVTQGRDNATQIPVELLQSTDNIIKLPAIVHELVHQKYSEKSIEDPSLSVFDWLQTQPFDVQRVRGIEILRGLGILK